MTRFREPEVQKAAHDRPAHFRIVKTPQSQFGTFVLLFGGGVVGWVGVVPTNQLVQAESQKSSTISDKTCPWLRSSRLGCYFEMLGWGKASQTWKIASWVLHWYPWDSLGTFGIILGPLWGQCGPCVGHFGITLVWKSMDIHWYKWIAMDIYLYPRIWGWCINPFL